MAHPLRFRNPECGLTLRVLVTSAGSAQTVLFAFLLTRIAGQEAGLLQDRTKGGIHQQQGAGNTVTHGFGLTGHAAASHVDAHVQLFSQLGQHEGLTDDHLQGLAGEVIFKGTTVHRDVAGASVDAGAGSGGLAAAGAVFEFVAHDVRSLVRQGQRLRVLSRVPGVRDPRKS